MGSSSYFEPQFQPKGFSNIKNLCLIKPDTTYALIVWKPFTMTLQRQTQTIFWMVFIFIRDRENPFLVFLRYGNNHKHLSLCSQILLPRKHKKTFSLRNLAKFHFRLIAYDVSVPDLCIISMISTMWRSIGLSGCWMANTASTTTF